MEPPDCFREITSIEFIIKMRIEFRISRKASYASGTPSGYGDHGSCGWIQFGSRRWQNYRLSRRNTQIQRSVQLHENNTINVYKLMLCEKLQCEKLEKLTKMRAMSFSKV
jgi:hypothetical protein